MYKKLTAMVLSLAMVFCTAAPAFASSGTETSVADGSADPLFATVSENPYMPYGTEIPEFEAPSEPSKPTETSEPTEPPAEPKEPSDEEPSNEEPFDEEPSNEEPAEPSDEESAEPSDDDGNAEEEAEKEAAIKYRNGLASYMRSKNNKLGKVWSRNLAQTFIDIGEKYDLDPTVLMALAQRESSFSSKATSPYGYKGIMQTSDWLARHYGYEPKELYDPEVSIDVAARYLRSLKKNFGTYTMALCGYMYGGTAVKNGNYSKKGAWKVMNIREEIKEYLEKWNFV